MIYQIISVGGLVYNGLRRRFQKDISTETLIMADDTGHKPISAEELCRIHLELMPDGFKAKYAPRIVRYELVVAP